VLEVEKMFAVIETGGKQYRVVPGMKLKIEKLEAEIGSAITFDKILLVSNGDELSIGHPYVSGTTVSAKLIDQAREKKIIVFKKKRRKMYQKKNGHRQYVSIVEIQGINA
jgi:large subunit ribosomal protein L21